MIDMQQDVVDVISRKMAPIMTDIAQSVKDQVSKDQRMDVEVVTSILQGWDGNFGEESVQATLFNRIHINFYLSLFHKYEEDEDERLAMTDGYAFFDFWVRMVSDVK